MTPAPLRAGEDVVRRVQGEYLEMPGLRLTEAQARRLWNLDEASCAGLELGLLLLEGDAHTGTSASACPLRDGTIRRSFFHRWSLRIRLAALCPPAAMTPPPGCVPAPHR